MNSGHIRHCGARGVHPVAPNSIIAWLKSPGRVRSSSDSARSPRRFPTLGCSEHAVENALYVAIHDGDSLSENNARDGRRSVASDTGKLAPLFRRAREHSLALARDHLRRLVHAACAMVIAETAPDRQHGRLARGGQRLHGGKFLQEARVVVHHRRDTGLLQHDLRDPYAIGIGVTAPGQLATMFVVPREQSAAKFAKCGRG